MLYWYLYLWYLYNHVQCCEQCITRVYYKVILYRSIYDCCVLRSTMKHLVVIRLQVIPDLLCVRISMAWAVKEF